MPRAAKGPDLEARHGSDTSDASTARMLLSRTQTAAYLFSNTMLGKKTLPHPAWLVRSP